MVRLFRPFLVALPLLSACAANRGLDLTRPAGMTLAPCPAEAALGVPEVLPEIVTQDGGPTLTLRDAAGPAAKPTHRPAKVHFVSADGSAVLMTEHLRTMLETKTTCFVMPATVIDLDWDNIAFDPNGGRLFAVHGDNAARSRATPLRATWPSR